MPVAERDLLADAARAVENAPWPKPDTVSFLSRMTGGAGEDKLSRDDAVKIYVSKIGATGAPFERLVSDAGSNLAAADRFNLIALHAMGAPRLAMSDIARVEETIQTLREHRLIFADAARKLEKEGETVDGAKVEEIRNAYAHTIKSLGETADLLADRIERDRTSTYARPGGDVYRKNFSSGL